MITGYVIRYYDLEEKQVKWVYMRYFETMISMLRDIEEDAQVQLINMDVAWR